MKITLAAAFVAALSLAGMPFVASASDVKTQSGTSLTVKPSAKKGTKSGSAVTGGAGSGSVFLTEQECTRLGGDVTMGIPNDSTCKTNLRCKTTLANGDIRSVCIDEVAN